MDRRLRSRRRRRPTEPSRGERAGECLRSDPTVGGLVADEEESRSIRIEIALGPGEGLALRTGAGDRSSEFSGRDDEIQFNASATAPAVVDSLRARTSRATQVARSVYLMRCAAGPDAVPRALGARGVAPSAADLAEVDSLLWFSTREPACGPAANDPHHDARRLRTGTVRSGR